MTIAFRVETKMTTEDESEWGTIPRPYDFSTLEYARERRRKFDACPASPLLWETRIVKITREVVE